MKFIIDSSAWIEYLEGSPAGQRVNDILHENNEIFILPINIAEIISSIKRKEKDCNLAYDILASNTKHFDITQKIAKEAGLLHAQLKDKIKGISLADIFIIISAKVLSAKVITCDRHFKSFKEAVII